MLYGFLGSLCIFSCVAYLGSCAERIHFERPKGLIPVSIAVICICSLVAALVYPPNMWDVLSISFAKEVMHWLQNHVPCALSSTNKYSKTNPDAAL